jgi:hypothetical protein
MRNRELALATRHSWCISSLRKQSKRHLGVSAFTSKDLRREEAMKNFFAPAMAVVAVLACSVSAMADLNGTNTNLSVNHSGAFSAISAVNNQNYTFGNASVCGAGYTNFDVDNLPHGVIVDNIGLNGVLIAKDQNEREIFLTAAKWVPETDRLCFAVENQAGRQTSRPVLLHVRKPNSQAAARIP